MDCTQFAYHLENVFMRISYVTLTKPEEYRIIGIES